LAVVVPLLPIAAMADIVHLNDGTSVQGTVRKSDLGWVVTSPDGKETEVDARTVLSIEAKKSAASDAGTAMSRLESLRRSVENVDDLKQIVSRYRNFVDLNAKTPAGELAAKDLQVWLDRQNQGLVKAGGKWVTLERREELKQKSILLADQARQLIKQDRLREAEPVLREALADDPANSAALYLHGILLYRQDQIMPARKSFEAVAAVVKDHGATLNNLAVIYWKQNQPGMALNEYDRAMVSTPMNRDILDNVAEAINALPDSFKTNPTANRVRQRFTEQDTRLQRELATKGLYRWGGTYIDQNQMDQIKAVEKENKETLSKLATDFDTAQSKLNSIDDQIRKDQRTMADLQATSVVTDQQGNIVQLPYPPSYWETSRDIDSLNIQRKDVVARLDQLRAAAKTVQQKFPVAKFTGALHLIGADAAPLNLAQQRVATTMAATTQATSTTQLSAP